MATIDPKRLSNIQLEILNKSKKELEEHMVEVLEEITSLKENIILNYKKLDNLSIEVESLKKQLNDLNDQIAQVNARTDDKDLLGKGEKITEENKKYEENVQKLEDLENKKNELIAKRDANKGFIIKQYYQKSIDKMDKQMEKLTNKQNKIVEKQRSIILSKQFLNAKRNQKIDIQEAKKEYYENLEVEMKNAKRDVLTKGGLFSNLKSKSYDRKARKYKKNKEKAEKALKNMKRKKVTLKGTRALVFAKNVINKQRNITYAKGVPHFAV